MSCCIDLVGRNTSTNTLAMVREPDTVPLAFPWNTQPWGLEVLSSNGADTSPAGNNARSVYVEYLDDAGIQRNVTVPLNGVTPVPVAVAAWRIQRAWVNSAGPGQVNAGDITFRETNGGTTQGFIVTGENRMLQGMWCCPSNQRVKLSNINVNYFFSTGSQTAIVTAFSRPVTGNAFIQRGTASLAFHGPNASMTDFEIEALEDVFFAYNNPTGALARIDISCDICTTGLGYAVVPGGFGPPK